MIDRRKLVGLMLFYFFATYAVLVVTFYASFLVDDYKIDSSFSGVLISLFFLAIMVPGTLHRQDYPAADAQRQSRLARIDLRRAALRGYFPRQDDARRRGFVRGLRLRRDPAVIYDKAATIAPPRSATLALSFVMAMNYLAVMVCPFIVDLFRHLFGTHSDRFPFFFNAALVLALTLVTFRRRDDFILGLDESYYKN